MSTFFQQTAQAMIAKHINRFPLLKLDQVIDVKKSGKFIGRLMNGHGKSAFHAKKWME